MIIVLLYKVIDLFLIINVLIIFKGLKLNENILER